MDPSVADYLSLVVLLSLSAFFSLSETSFTATSESKIHKLKSDGSKKASKLLKLLESREKLISFILFGNNAANIFASSIATVIAIRYFDSNPVLSPHASEISSVTLTLVVLIFAEILPKTIAMNYSERISMAITGVYHLLMKIFGPLVSTFNGLILSILKPLGIKVGYDELFSATETIRGEIEYFHSKGSFVKNDKDMLGGVLDLVDMNVESIMTHRKDVDMVNIEDDIEEIIHFVNQSGHTRIPVYEEKTENIIGILHLRDLFILINNRKQVDCGDLKKILLKPMFISNKTKLRSQLFEFKKTRNHMAVVVDEYGGVMGIVTLEDIIEEIVGDIEDEHDEFEKYVFKESPGVMIVSGECLIRDFNREVGSSFHYDDVSTIAGLVIRVAEKIPEEQEEFLIASYKFTVIKKELNKITYLRVEEISCPQDSEGGGEEGQEMNS